MQITFSEFLNQSAKELSATPFFNFYYIAGGDYFVHQFIVKKLVAKHVDKGTEEFNYHVFAAEKDKPISELLDLILSYPIFSENKLVHIKNAGEIPKTTSLKLIEAFKQVHPKTIIVVSADEGSGKNDLDSFFKKTGCVIKAVLSEGELLEYGKNKFKINKVEIKPDAILLMVNKIGHNLGLLDAEIEKLISYAKTGGHITKNDVDNLVAKNTFSKMYHVSDLIARRDLKEAVNLLETLFNEEGKDFLYMVLGYLNKHFKNLLAIKVMMEKGASADKIAENAGMKLDYYFKNCLKQAQCFSVKELVNFFEYFQKTDFNIKDGRNPLLALELMLVGMCAKQ